MVKRFISVIHDFFSFLNDGVSRLFPGIGSYWNELSVRRMENRLTTVTHRWSNKAQDFHLYIPNSLTRYRANTFSSKEPETLAWIDTHASTNGVFFDIGANVGLYSLYHAVTKKGTVYAFEPSVFNLKLLVKNINANQCQERINIICNPLTESNGFADFNLQQTTDGGALSSFGVEYGHDGKPLQKAISYRTLGFSLDDLIEKQVIHDVPELIKIDVDGIEHLILRGAKKTIADPACRSVLIEVNDAFTELSAEVNTILSDAGFSMLEKVSPQDDNTGDNFTSNQIWAKTFKSD